MTLLFEFIGAFVAGYCAMSAITWAVSKALDRFFGTGSPDQYDNPSDYRR